MKSKANIAGHALHPILVTIPAGGFLLTLVLDIVHIATGQQIWWAATLPVLLVSVIGALVAAIPGLVDLVSIVPGGAPRRIGVAHFLLNLLVVAVFALNTWVRWTWATDVQPLATPGFPLTLLGTLLLAVSGWLGWTMVQSWHIGVLEEGEGGHASAPRLANPRTNPG
jgi:uncharacterized membrane protein